ncbi:MAG: hypothetical protein ABJQ93_17140 [Luteolibacter sp.]
MAHSGAFLTGDPADPSKRLHGEVPSPWPSVLEQIRTAREPGGRKVRIIVEGGINEVGGGRISSPTTSARYLESATKAACYVTLGKVLTELSERFPEAEIYVLGYYQILADRAKRDEVEGLLKEEGITPGEIDEADFDLRERAVENSRRFHELSDHWIGKAVAETAAKHKGSCKFVASGFEEWEGMFGERSLVFSPWTRDAMRGKRARLCTMAIARGRTGLHCYLAATAHPNRAGMERYVSQITTAMAGSGRG